MIYGSQGSAIVSAGQVLASPAWVPTDRAAQESEIKETVEITGRTGGTVVQIGGNINTGPVWFEQ